MLTQLNLETNQMKKVKSIETDLMIIINKKRMLYLVVCCKWMVFLQICYITEIYRLYQFRFRWWFSKRNRINGRKGRKNTPGYRQCQFGEYFRRLS